MSRENEIAFELSCQKTEPGWLSIFRLANDYSQKNDEIWLLS